MKKANRNLRPSTHLVVYAPEGSKYVAAKKWNLPAVTNKLASIFIKQVYLIRHKAV